MSAKIVEDDEDTPLGTLMEQQARRKGRSHTTNLNNEGEQVLAGEKARYERIKAQQRAERAERDKALEAERRAERRVREAEEEAIREEQRQKAAEEERVRREKEEARERAMQEKLKAKQRAKDEKEARKRRPTETTLPSQETSDRRRSSSRDGSASSPTSTKRVGGFFRRKKEEETPRTSTTTDDRRPKTAHASPPKWEFPTIRPGGGGIVPLSDAPLSGVAHVERRVRIKFGKSEINLPVDSATTAQQLIKSASNVMSETFNPRAAIIYEYYCDQGVRRPLRMYEHLHAVMNSWQDDYKNYLVIEESDLESDQELYEANAPQQHSLKQFERWLKFQYKSNKWDDRWVTVRTDGQITAAKNQSGKDQANVCNLSDFDIYRPVPEGKRKKSSKKVVMSIKSQQKSAMFLDLADFIHHFYTEDRKVADEFFRAVQDWRSSYLVNKLGQGKAADHHAHGESHEAGHNRNKSVESHYMLGSFNDLGLDFSSFDKPPEPVAKPAAEPQTKHSFEEHRPLGAFGLIMPSAQEHSKMIHSRQLSQRQARTRVPPTAMRHAIPHRPGGRDDALQALSGANAPVRQSWDSNRSGEGAFNPNGLLGSQYEQRRHNTRPSQDQGHGGGGLQRNTSVRSTRSQRRNSFDSATLGRQDSVRRPELDFGKPLLDFTPQYKEPPQFARRGKGIRPDQAPPGTLIDLATTPDNPLGLPSQDDWRVRPKTSAGSGGLDRSKSINRTKSVKRPNAVPEESEAFTGIGLLASQSGRAGWGDDKTGHGVVSANQARGGPMLDMSERSMFANGTLLRRMEAGGMGNPTPREQWRVND
jgi:flagellar biosynthesis GTPase FlhF